MVTLLKTDNSLTSSPYVRSENTVHPVGSQLAFGLGGRRNYLVVAGLVVFVLVLMVRVAQGSATESMPDGEPAAVVSSADTYVVQPGDTLWGIATELAPGEDPRPVVDQLVELNDSASIAAGQEIVLPDDLSVDS